MSSSTVRKTTITEIDAGFNCVISDMKTPDAYGDIVGSEQNVDGGWLLKNYRLNPIATFNHNRDFVVGKIEGVQWKNGALHGRLKLAPQGTSERIDEIRKLIACGVIKGVSAEFKPLESVPLKSGGTNFLRQELIAVSICSIPCNPNALLQAKAAGVRTATIREIMKEQSKNLTLAERIAEARATVQAERVEVQRRAEAIVAKIPTAKPKYTEAERIAIQRKAKAANENWMKKKAEAEKQEAFKKSEKKADAQTRDTEAYLENLREQGLLVEFPAEVRDYTIWQGQRIPYSKKWRDDE
jgi:flagellar biosynthesis GTPase FlhF